MINEPNLGEAMYGTVRETAIIPRQVATMKPMTTVAGVQIRQLQVSDAQPNPQFQAPINIQRQSLGGGVFKFSIQSIRDPAATNFSSVSVLLKTPNGITSLQAEGNSDLPITFTAGKSTAPGSVAIQTNTTTGTFTSTDFGVGNSSRINRL